MTMSSLRTEKRLEKLDQKVNIINEIASAKPKPIKAKRKIDKVKCINGQKAANEEHQKFNTK